MLDAQFDESLIDHSSPLYFRHLNREAIIRRELDIVADSELSDHHILLRHEPHQFLPSTESFREEEDGDILGEIIYNFAINFDDAVSLHSLPSDEIYDGGFSEDSLENWRTEHSPGTGGTHNRTEAAGLEFPTHPFHDLNSTWEHKGNVFELNQVFDIGGARLRSEVDIFTHREGGLLRFI